MAESTVVHAATPFAPGFAAVTGNNGYDCGLSPGDAALVLANQSSINTQGINSTVNDVGRNGIATTERFGLNTLDSIERHSLAELEAIRDTKEAVTNGTRDILIDNGKSQALNMVEHCKTQHMIQMEACSTRELIREEAAKTQLMLRDDREQALRDDLALVRQELLLVRIGQQPCNPLPVCTPPVVR